MPCAQRKIMQKKKKKQAVKCQIPLQLCLKASQQWLAKRHQHRCISSASQVAFTNGNPPSAGKINLKLLAKPARRWKKKKKKRKECSALLAPYAPELLSEFCKSAQKWLLSAARSFQATKVSRPSRRDYKSLHRVSAYTAVCQSLNASILISAVLISSAALPVP